MALPDIFSKPTVDALIRRIHQLSPATTPLWGKMTADQMLAHCNVSYEYVFEPEKYKPTPAIIKLVLKLFLKDKVVNEAPYKQNTPTGPDFKITARKDFEAEKARLIHFLEKVADLGPAHFEGKNSHSFGKLTATEWNNMFYKHLNHHLSQFGV